VKQEKGEDTVFTSLSETHSIPLRFEVFIAAKVHIMIFQVMTLFKLNVFHPEVFDMYIISNNIQ